MKLWERLGLEQRFINQFDSQETLEEHAIAPTKWSNGGPTQKSSAVSFPNFIACICYLREEIPLAMRYADMTVENGIDYFFSDWRKKVAVNDKTYESYRWKEHGSDWYSEFPISVLWTTCLGQWNKAKKIAEYPTRECYSERTKGSPEVCYYLILAAALRGESLDTVNDFIEVVETGVKKREKLLLAVLKTIVQQDKKAFDKVFLEYMKYFNKRECSRGINTLAKDGTILFNFARYKGLNVEFPNEYRDHFICLEQDK
jgi:hypothetical protein